MRSRSDPRTWTKLFAAGLLVRPVLIVPMAPSGPLAGSDLLPIALASLLALSFLIAAGAFLGNRAAMALGVLTAVGGIPLAAVIGVALDLPLPWALLLAGYNAVLAVVGLQAWREADTPPSGPHRR